MQSESAVDMPTDAPLVAQEVYLLVFFFLGFFIFRSEFMQRHLRPNRKRATALSKKMMAQEEVETPKFAYTPERLGNDFRCGEYQRVVNNWDSVSRQAYNIDVLCMTVQSFLALGRPGDIGRLLSNAIAQGPSVLNAGVHKIIEQIAKPDLDINKQFINVAIREICDKARHVLPDLAVETLLLILAEANDESRVSQLLRLLRDRGAAATPSTLVQVSRRFLACKNLDATFGHLHCAFSTAGSPSQEAADVNCIPDELIVAAVRAASEEYHGAGCTGDRPRAWDAMDLLDNIDTVQLEALVLLLDWAAQQSPPDAILANRIEGKVKAQARGKMVLPIEVCTAFVKFHAATTGDGAANQWLDEFINALDAIDCTKTSEDCLLGMVSACSEVGKPLLVERLLNWAIQNRRCTSQMLAAALKVFMTAKIPERLCDLYERLEPEGLDFEDATLRVLLKATVQTRRLKLARRLFKRMRKLDAQSCILMIRASGHEGDALEALELLKHLETQGEASTLAYNSALDAALSCNDKVSAQSVFVRARACGCTDAVSYNIILKHIGNCDLFAAATDAEGLLEEMRRCGVQPTTSTYNSTISSALASGDFQRAWRTVRRLEAGPGVDSHTITILFKGYRRDRHGMDPKAFDNIVRLIGKNSVKIDDILVNSALEACSGQRDSARLEACLETFKRRGWQIPEQCSSPNAYGLLIKAYGQTYQTKAVWQIWREATLKRVVTEQMYGQMIDALVSNGCIEDALLIFEDMKVKFADRLDSQGFAVAYAMIIKGFAQKKDCSRALECYEEMQSHNVGVGVVIFNTLIDACSRVGNMDAAARLFRDMMDAECLPDLITYSTLIKGYCVRGEVDKAMELFALMCDKGIKPDAIVFNCLLDGCAKQQMPNMCEQVFQEMVQAGIPPSNYSASILIKLYGRCQEVDAAFRVFNDMPSKYGFRPNVAVYTCLMSTCIANGRLRDAMSLRERMVQEGEIPDEKTYSTLLRGALRAGDVNLCMSTVQAALNQCGRGLLDEELAQSVLNLIQKRSMWESHGRHLVESLWELGLSVQIPAQGDKNQQGRQNQRTRAQQKPGRNAGPDRQKNNEGQTKS